jgi:hypothetical protein
MGGFGLSQHKLHSVWANMIQRCEHPRDPSFRNYGGRGITVCPRWHSFPVFLEDILGAIGQRPAGMTLDRVRNDGNYEPGNVRWATHKQQANNRRNRFGAGARSVQIRFKQNLFTALETWRRQQETIPSRPEAIRTLIWKSLTDGSGREVNP